MLIGYVSDDRYVALPDVLLEFEWPGGCIEARSRASGAVHAEVPPGPCTVTLAKDGYGAKRSEIVVGQGPPHQFRLLPDTLLGYAWPKWVCAGERSEFRVHSAEPYSLKLYRYGFEKQLVRNLGWFDEHGPRATVQITPDSDYTRCGVGWNRRGYANPHHLQYVAAPDRSGLYYFHARGASGREFNFPWIVAPARPSAPAAVLASNLTWNAYNNFGGRSNYINPDELPPRPIVNARLELRRYTDPTHQMYDAPSYAPLSFDRPEPINHIAASERPTDPIEGRSACHLAPAEWRLLAWMEREGFAYDYYAESHLHDGSLDLDAYRVLILSTHPEYWTRVMFDRVRSWVFERGGRLIYLGGNGVNCEVELPTPDTMVIKNGSRGLIPEGLDSRFHLGGASEAGLLGVAFTDAGVMTAAPYAVVDDSHWAFEGTGLRNGDLFGRRSLHMRCEGGASGHETDKRSPSSPPGTRVLARGLNPDDGGAEMVYFETPGDGSVFSAGSITYPACLLVDDPLSHVTANVLLRSLA